MSVCNKYSKMASDVRKTVVKFFLHSLTSYFFVFLPRVFMNVDTITSKLGESIACHASY